MKRRQLVQAHMSRKECDVLDHLQGKTEKCPRSGMRSYSHLEALLKNPHILSAVHHHAREHHAMGDVVGKAWEGIKNTAGNVYDTVKPYLPHIGAAAALGAGAYGLNKAANTPGSPVYNAMGRARYVAPEMGRAYMEASGPISGMKAALNRGKVLNEFQGKYNPIFPSKPQSATLPPMSPHMEEIARGTYPYAPQNSPVSFGMQTPASHPATPRSRSSTPMRSWPASHPATPRREDLGGFGLPFEHGEEGTSFAHGGHAEHHNGMHGDTELVLIGPHTHKVFNDLALQLGHHPHDLINPHDGKAQYWSLGGILGGLGTAIKGIPGSIKNWANPDPMQSLMGKVGLKPGMAIGKIAPEDVGNPFDIATNHLGETLPVHLLDKKRLQREYAKSRGVDLDTYANPNDIMVGGHGGTQAVGPRSVMGKNNPKDANPAFSSLLSGSGLKPGMKIGKIAPEDVLNPHDLQIGPGGETLPRHIWDKMKLKSEAHPNFDRDKFLENYFNQFADRRAGTVTVKPLSPIAANSPEMQVAGVNRGSVQPANKSRYPHSAGVDPEAATGTFMPRYKAFNQNLPSYRDY